MNKKKLLSFVLCFAILLSLLISTNKMPTAVGVTSKVYESKEPVTPPESDFTYRKIPVNEPTRIVISRYNGKETKVIIPETIEGLPVKSISASAFSGNENLTYIKLPSSLTGISGKAFNLCSSLTEIAVNPDNTTFATIDGVLYRRDTISTSETYGDLTTLSIFPAGKGGHFTVPYGVKSIGTYAFDHCYNLTSVDMYNTVTDIGSYAFSFCWNLTSIRLSDNLSSLGTFALSHCKSLRRIDLPASLTNIGTDAVLGTIDSKDNKVYYFTKGISCTINTYAHQYLKDQWLPESIIILNKPSITDNDTGIKLIDAYGILPENEILDITIKPVEISKVESLFPTRYSEAYAFDIDITKNGETYLPKGNVVFNFDSVCSNAIPSATKVYQVVNGKLVLVSGSAHSPFVGAQASQGGRFIILVNDDFSIKGDVDGDGSITLFDVKATLHSAAGNLSLTYEQIKCANTDNSTDNKITTADARKTLRLAGGMNIE